MTLKFSKGWIKLQLAFFKYLYSTSKQMKLEIPFPAWAATLLEWGLQCHATYFHFFDFFLWRFYWITNQGQGTESYCLKSSVFLRINRYPVKQVRQSFNSELFWEHESHLHRSSLSQHWKDVLALKFVYSKKST